jgi:thiol-disulfide isomerase/thioredoxin
MRGDDDDWTDEEEPGPPPPAWARWGRTLAEWTLTLVAVAVVWVAIGAWRAPELPDAAPDFALPDLSGEVVSLSSLRGKTVVLNFWAEWCGPCRVEIPTFSRFARSHPDVPVLGVAVDGTAAELRRAAQKLGIDYPVLVADAQIQQTYGVTTLPTTIVVGPDGGIRSAHAGIMLGPQLRWATR